VSGSLKLIKGVVDGLTVHAGEDEFVRSAGQQAAGVGAAAGLALDGMAGAAAGAGLAASSAGDSVQFFTCKLGEQLMQGRFSKVTFKDGDELDMVIASQRNGRPLVLAARRSSDRVLWMAPHYSRGIAGHKNYAWRLFLWLVPGMPLFFFSPFLIWLLFTDTAIDIGSVEFGGVICIVLGLIAAPYYAIRFYRQWLPFARQAEQIFAVLGYPDPSRVDLPREHKQYCKSNGIGWPYTVNNGVEAGPWTYHYVESKAVGAAR
jgi:hypothetical protein